MDFAQLNEEEKDKVTNAIVCKVLAFAEWLAAEITGKEGGGGGEGGGIENKKIGEHYIINLMINKLQ